MRLFKEKIKSKKILIASASIIILGLSMVIIVGIRKMDSKNQEELSDITTYATKQVIDYPEGEGSNPLIWETVYNPEKAVSIVYGDGKEIRRFNGGNVDRIVDFSPEVKGIYNTEAAADFLKHELGIIYNMSLEQSCQYVASQIDKDYRLIRKILTAKYAEVYLMSPEDRIIRILALPEKMLMAELNENVVLDNIESYFN